MSEERTEQDAEPERRVRPRTVVWIVLVAVLATAGGTWYLMRTYLQPAPFEPVRLEEEEARRLDAKLRALGYDPAPAAQSGRVSDEAWLRPEAYRETAGSRTLFFTERELNALIANNKDLARRVAVDLSDDKISVRALVPVDPDFPVLGGKTLRLSGGVELAVRDGRPVVRLLGVSLMGVPIPGAWLGGLKNVDLIEQFGDADGFWTAFVRGVETIEVEEGRLKLTLKE